MVVPYRDSDPVKRAYTNIDDEDMAETDTEDDAVDEFTYDYVETTAKPESKKRKQNQTRRPKAASNLDYVSASKAYSKNTFVKQDELLE